MTSESVASMPPVLTGCSEDVQSEAASLGPPQTQLLKHRSDNSSRLDGADESLLAEVLRGSKEALGLLFRRHRRSVINVASRILKDSSEAEDLCQEVFLYIFQKAGSFDSVKGTASSWIIQIAYSRALNRRQYLTARQHYNAQELNEEGIEGKQSPLFVDVVLAKSLLRRIKDQLSEEQRYTLELHFFEGYSLREIAQKTGQTIGNIRHHYYRGLERLRSHVFPQKAI
jgi:RNA polymerase sigma-70 factor (ECF subfamily)